MTKVHNVPLTDAELIQLITGQDLIARSLGNGQQQGGLAAIAEVRTKSAPVLALADKLQAYLPKEQAAAHPGPPAAKPQIPTPAEKRAASRRK